MASWKSMLTPCSDQLFKVDVIWNDGQESYVKKFNNGIPTLVHNVEFYKNSQFFLLLSGKSKKNITNSVFIDLPDHGLIKLFSSSREFADLFQLHWSSVGINNILVDDKVEKKGKRPSKAIIDTVFEFFNDISKNLPEDAIKKSNELCDVKNSELHDAYLASKPVGKPRGRKPKILTPQEIAHRERLKTERKERRSLSSRKIRATKQQSKSPKQEPQVLVSVDIEKYINESLASKKITDVAMKCNVSKDADGIFRVSTSHNVNKGASDTLMSVDLPFRTRNAAKAAQKLLEEAHEKENTVSPFSLYISTAKTGNVGKSFYKICDGLEDLMSIFADDWSGTALGFSLHKTTNNNLGKFLNSDNILNRLISVRTTANNTVSLF